MDFELNKVKLSIYLWQPQLYMCDTVTLVSLPFSVSNTVLDLVYGL